MTEKTFNAGVQYGAKLYFVVCMTLFATSSYGYALLISTICFTGMFVIALMDICEYMVMAYRKRKHSKATNQANVLIQLMNKTITNMIENVK